MKLALLGDSIAKGIIQDPERNRYLFAANAFYKASPYPIDNFAKMGSTVSTGLATFERFREKIKQTDVVFLLFGGNDCNFNLDVIETPDSPYIPNTPLPQFREKYGELIQKVVDLGKKPALLSLPPVAPHKLFKSEMRNRDPKKIMAWLHHDVTVFLNYHEIYNLEVFKLGQKHNIPVIDLTTPLLSIKNYETYFCNDGMHPNEEGHKILSRVFQSEIQRVFPERQRVWPALMVASQKIRE